MLLSKTDLVFAGETKAIKTRLRRINTTADIISTAEIGFRPSDLWNLTSMRKDTVPQKAIAWTTPKTVEDPLENVSGFASVPTTTAVTEFRHHDSDITSLSVVLDAPLNDIVFDQ